MNKFTLVLPTMWRYAPFMDFLPDLLEHELVDEVIVFDNDPSRTPDTGILDHPKINYQCVGENIYVNPAWNKGVELSRNKFVAFISDDVIFDLRLLSRVAQVLSDKCGVIGNCPGLAEYNQKPFKNGSINLVPWYHDHTFGFGCLMFVYKDTYLPIPDGLKLFYGDQWIFDTYMARGYPNWIITNMLFHTPHAATTTDPSTNLDIDKFMTDEKIIYDPAFAEFMQQLYAPVR